MTEALPPDRLRASDADRQAVEGRLRAAHDSGFITLAEFDERLGAVYRCKTRGDLAKVLMDLPAETLKPSAPGPVRPRARNPRAMRVLTTIWLAISLVNVVIWGLVCITSFELVYPWWLWVVAPTGVVLATIWWMFGPKPDAGGND